MCPRAPPCVHTYRDRPQARQAQTRKSSPPRHAASHGPPRVRPRGSLPRSFAGTTSCSAACGRGAPAKRPRRAPIGGPSTLRPRSGAPGPENRSLPGDRRPAHRSRRARRRERAWPIGRTSPTRQSSRCLCACRARPGQTSRRRSRSPTSPPRRRRHPPRHRRARRGQLLCRHSRLRRDRRLSRLLDRARCRNRRRRSARSYS